MFRTRLQKAHGDAQLNSKTDVEGASRGVQQQVQVPWKGVGKNEWIILLCLRSLWQPTQNCVAGHKDQCCRGIVDTFSLWSQRRMKKEKTRRRIDRIQRQVECKGKVTMAYFFFWRGGTVGGNTIHRALALCSCATSVGFGF